MIEIGFFGFNEVAIVELINSDKFNLKYIVTQKNRLSVTANKLLQVLEIPVIEIENKNELFNIRELVETAEMVLICFFGIIVPKEIYQNIPCFNIHTGDLHTNRGPYPLVWDILLDKEKSFSTLYRLGEKVDTGEIVSVCSVDVEREDNIDTLTAKLDRLITVHLDKLCEYDENKNYEIVKEGIYRKKVDEDDILIEASDSYDEINRKIRAQSKYGGAFLDWKGYKLRISSIEEVFK